MSYEPVPLDQTFKSFEIKGWYRLRVDSAKPGMSSGGYSQIKLILIVEDGEYQGCQVHHYFIIPTLEKAFAKGKRSYWMLRTGWVLQVFGFDLNKGGDESKNLRALQSERNLQKIYDKMVGQSCVGLVEPEEYPKAYIDKETGEEKIVTRIAGRLRDIRDTDYQPDEGFVENTPTPPVAQTTQSVPQHSQQTQGTADGQPAGNGSNGVDLDPDMDLEEEEDFFVD